MATQPRVKCENYRAEQVLLGIRRQLEKPGLDPQERQRLENEVERLEKEMGLR